MSHGIESGPIGLKTLQRVVVPIDDRDAAGCEDRLHWRGLSRRKPHGDEAQPMLARIGAAHLQGLQNSSGNSQDVEHSMRWNVLTAKGGCGGHERDRVEVRIWQRDKCAGKDSLGNRSEMVRLCDTRMRSRPSRLSVRFLRRKLEMWDCPKPV